MRNLFLAVLAILSLGAAIAPTFAQSSIADDAKATRMQQTGTISK